ncbi:MAG: site-specific DNA-methyltransferase [Paludibacter sp.]|nr:site-specific DNA-methyltransferase [Paludibacter sp.]
MPTLHWIGKEKVINHHMDVPFKVLEHSYGFDNGQQTETETKSGNKIIHGDNLEALKTLLPEYEGQIKCIYIDPPYNTGNESWVYNDNVNDPKIKKWLGQVVGKEAEDLTRHDKWLCMMYPRLKLLHKLLADDGAIFISIDDNEQANLKLVMDEIFGLGNYITSIVWQSRQSIQNDTDLSINHEYILAFAKNRRKKDRRLKPHNEKYWYDIKEFAFYPKPVDEDKFSNPDNDDRGKWKADPFDAPAIRENLTYPIINPNTGEEYLPPKGRHWRTEKTKYEALLADNRIVFGKTGKTKPQLKVFLNEKNDFGSVSNSWFTGEENGTATHGTKELQKIFEKDVNFETPKPYQLIQNILKIATRENDLILDSFAGSGTTAQAVLNLNHETGSKRKFILVEMSDYADTITAERVKKVSKGYSEVNGIGGSFDFFTLGQPMFLEDGNLNEIIGIEKIRQYVYYTETKSAFSETKHTDNKHFLGKYNDTAYYFNYEKDEVTTLDHAFLATMKTKAEQYVIYTDNCLLTKDFMTKHHINFKKIPRDITRF